MTGCLRTNAKVSFRCVFHLVWCTQYRAPVLGADVGDRLRDVIAEVVAEREAWLLDVNVAPSYVHLVVEVCPQLGIHRLVKAIKGRTARALRDEFPVLRSRLPSLWTNAYLVTTVGNALPSPVIEHFVSQQPTR